MRTKKENVKQKPEKILKVLDEDFEDETCGYCEEDVAVAECDECGMVLCEDCDCGGLCPDCVEECCDEEDV